MMTMLQKNTAMTNVREPGSTLLSVAIVVFGVAFFFVEHDLRRSQLEAASFSAEEMELAVAAGSWQRPFGFSLIAGLGVFLLLGKEGNALCFDDPLAALVLLAAAWCVASVFWSPYPALTAKRIAVLMFCCLGALGMCRRFTSRELCVFAAFTLTAYCLLGIATEMAVGTFRPWASDYRFTGTVHPNTQGTYCAALALAAAALMTDTASRRRVSWACLFAAAVVLLLMTKSRAAVVGATVALPVVLLPKMSARMRLLGGVGGAWAVSTLLLLGTIAGASSVGKMGEVVLMGRTENVGSLGGRIPLWSEVLGFIGNRPLLGYGYDSFWSPEHIASVSSACDWAICSAHSVYLETTLSVGLIGAVLLFAAAVAGGGRLGKRYLGEGNGGDGFFVGLFVFGAVGGCLESGFIQPMFVPVVAACGLAHAAFCRFASKNDSKNQVLQNDQPTAAPDN